FVPSPWRLGPSAVRALSSIWAAPSPPLTAALPTLRANSMHTPLLPALSCAHSPALKAMRRAEPYSHSWRRGSSVPRAPSYAHITSTSRRHHVDITSTSRRHHAHRRRVSHLDSVITTPAVLDPTLLPVAERVVEAMLRLHVPGVAVGLFHEGQEYSAGFGVTSVENPLPVTADTLFQIGSTTKTVTGTSAMRLVEQGILDLDAPVRPYLPDLRLAAEDVAARVTLRHLFTHTGGWPGDYFEDTGSGDDALARMVARLHLLPQQTPLGMLYAYNNAGFYIAGRVIEAVTSRPYESVARELVLEPLGMSMTFFTPSDVMTHRFAVGHIERAGSPTVARPWPLARAANAVGGLASTAIDQLRYARFHLGDGTTLDGVRLLSPESMRLMQSPQGPGGN